ncbi:MAG TPA: AAA family ATPase, partial [Pseudomonadales bacterium]
HKNNPLAMDVLIVDEASMVDLPMMYRLLDALAAHTRLILLGDKDQLASVEAGSVLAELCQSQGLAGNIAQITVSRRFASQPEIGALASWLNNPDGVTKPVLAAAGQVRLHTCQPGSEWQPAWLADAVQQYRQRADIQAGAGVLDMLARQQDFQLLCALRQGPFGVVGINRMIATALARPHDGWYAGRPVIVLENAAERQLYNGDVGMVLPLDPLTATLQPEGGTLKACFLTADGFRAVSQAQMPAHETCYAMTVHKSQGSEYRHVMIVLPCDRRTVADNPVLSRELVYTAVTRASRQIDIFAGDGVLDSMAQRRTVRMSALASLLHKPQNEPSA